MTPVDCDPMMDRIVASATQALSSTACEASVLMKQRLASISLM